ncbi:MAG: hypothetical protein IJV55_08175 [Paludibacteraceae bacterium]|nr:hypothetical protein [Paludibacteraceae bacterium]
MKKRIASVLVALACVGAANAWEFPGFEWTVGADITSSYLWRGINLGGLAFQPDASIGYGGLKAEVWANLSPSDYTFKTFAPELDVTLSYSVFGFKVGATHQYYFDGTKYFDFRKPTPAQYDAGDYAGNQTEVFFEYNLGDVLEDVPFHFGWYTYVGGDDWKTETDENDNTLSVERAWSTYIDLSYDFALPLNFTLTPTVGMTPWKSMYNYYEGNFSVNNVSLKLNWELEAGDHFCLDVYGIAMLNTAGINKTNVWPAVSNSYNNQRLNLALGIGLWLY